MPPRRFPPPWTIEEMNDACFIVRDKNGQGLGYFYFEEESGRRTAANMLTKDEARRLAVNFASCRSCCVSSSAARASYLYLRTKLSEWSQIEHTNVRLSRPVCRAHPR